MFTKELLHSTCPYEGFSPLQSSVHGWNSTSVVFRQVIERVRPNLIIEVGTWKGASAIHMANLCWELELSTLIVCVDTWLGSTEMWCDHHDGERYRALDLRHGYPQVYYQFLSNVIHAGHQDRIVPFPQTSLNAAAWFRGRELQADLVYLDASHEYADVKADMEAWWPLVRSGGALLGDDYHENWSGVRAAVDESPLKPEVLSEKWLAVKAAG